MASSSATLASSARAANSSANTPNKSSAASPNKSSAHASSVSTPTPAESSDPAADEVEREPLDDFSSPPPPPPPSSSASMPQASSLASSPSAASSRSSASAGFDRELFTKLEEVTSELDRLTRLSSALPETRELDLVQQQLKRAQRSSSVMVQTQRELLDKIERHERSSFRRYFQFNREQKAESLKDALWARMSESQTLERELAQLERKSDTLLEARRTTLGGSGDDADQLEAAQLAWRMDELERERQELVGALLQTIPVPETRQLSTRIAMYVSEIRASESIQRQVERCAAMYRDALRDLQAALAVLLAPTYTGALKEFVTGPYLLAVEAAHQIEAASHVLQPEARRRYRSYAPDLLHVRPPKFPQAIVDFAKRARVNYDRKSSLSVEGTRKLHAAENVVVLLHRIVIQKLELLDQWRAEVEQDVARASEAHRRAEARLHQQMAVLARSASA